MKSVLVTGGTGFLGREIVKQLLHKTHDSVWILVRPGKDGADARVESLFGKFLDENGCRGRLSALAGDVSKPSLGLAEDDYRHLCEEVSVIFHSAAICEFGVLWEKIHLINVVGTENMLEFAILSRGHKLEHVHHVSTLAVAGTSSGTFYESELDRGQEFQNTYERSKYEAEKLVEDYRLRGLPVSVHRPGLISGHSQTGETSAVQMIYQYLHIISLGLYEELPSNMNLSYGMSPVDSVADSIVRIARKNNGHATYHISNPDTMTFKDFVESAVNTVGIQAPKIVPKEAFDFSKLRGFSKKILDNYLPYMLHDELHFDAQNFDMALADTDFKWPEADETYMTRMFRYCERIGL